MPELINNTEKHNDDKLVISEIIIVKLDNKLYNYFKEISLNVNNLYNVGQFYMRQTFSVQIKDETTKEFRKKTESELHANQKEVFNIINKAIPNINNTKESNYNEYKITNKDIIEKYNILVS